MRASSLAPAMTLPSPFRHADETAIALDDGVRARTFAELEGRVARLGSLLRDDLGVPAGGHVALLTPNRIEGVELVIASLLAGVWITPASHHLAKDEIAYVLEDSGARVVFVDRSLLALLPAGFEGEVVDLDSLDARLERVREMRFDADSAPGGTMIYTSGTSGRPKGVKRALPSSLGLALSAWRDGGRAFGFDGSGPHLVTGPLYHAAPLLFAVYDLLNGAPVIVMRRWDERAFLELVRSRRVRHTHLVPTTLVRLLRLPEGDRPREALASLSLVMHGAAPITPEVKRAAIDWLGPVVVEYWGATEGGIYTLVSANEWLARPGTVGRVIPSFRVFAVDDEGNELPPLSEGTLVCRHARLERPFVYHRDDEKTERAYRAPFEFTVGDLGWVDEDGYVFLGERRSNLILSGGVNIYPAEIERVLASHPRVADVAVFGVPDEEWGERVVAAVELVDGTTDMDAARAELASYAREKLAGFKVPREIAIHAKLPRTEAGKMRARDLRALHARSSGGAKPSGA